MPKVYVASDHAGFELKQKLLPFIESLGHEVEDCGAFSFDKDDDYPDFIFPCAKKVAADAGSFGIIAGASGQGEAMAANRIPGVRAGVYYGDPGKSQTDAGGEELSLIASMRAHNDANVLSLGLRFLDEEGAQAAIRTFLTTPFQGGRHERRVKKLG
jgi:ribose 5-phosphate isomerase B